MEIIKRTGDVVAYDNNRIIRAIIKAMAETEKGVDERLAKKIEKRVREEVECDLFPMTVENIQDLIEDKLMISNRKDVAKRYILFRAERNNSRNKRSKFDYKVLTEEFVSQYKHKVSPMKQLGNFIYYRTYSRWLPEENRREFWWETVRRAVDYSCSLVPTSRKEAEKLYDNIFNLRQFLSGRTFWVGNTDVAKHYPISNYNCAFEIIDNFNSFRDLFYLLMVGSGVGIRILKDDVSKLSKIRTNYELINKDYDPVVKEDRKDNTSLKFINNNTAIIIVGDSKEGWVQSLDFYLKLLHSNEYRNIKTIIVSYDNVRPVSYTHLTLPTILLV